MHDQTIGTAVVTTPEEARTPSWKARAVEEYERSLQDRRARLRMDLATRLVGLIGRPLPPEDACADADGWLAVASADGETFRLYRRGSLVLVRPCAYCGTGRFESHEITDPVDLGYALSAWRPLHEGCEDYASETLADW